MHSRPLYCSGVVLETRVLVSRRLEDKNESLGLVIKVLVLKKSLDYIITNILILYCIVLNDVKSWAKKSNILNSFQNFA